MVIIGEKLNSSIKKVFASIESRDEAFVSELAKAQQKAGATYLDINAAMLQENEAESLVWLLNTVRAASNLPFVIDSPDPAAVKAALEAYTGEKPIINSITLEKERFDAMLPLALTYNTGLIALCMEDGGMPESAERRVQIACELVEKFTGAGIAKQDIYIDPMVRPVGSGDEYGPEALASIRGIRAALPDVHIVCGLSNISFGLPARALMNRTFLTAAMTQGLDSAIMDPLDAKLMSSLAAAEALLGLDEYCENYLDAYREGLFNQ